MTAAGPPPGGQPPVQPDSSPASVGQLRTLRRWVAVAGVWAVAATVVALIALLDVAGEDAPRDDARRVAADIGALQRSVDRSLAQLDKRVRDVASTDDLQRLDDRLEEMEDKVSAAADNATDAADSADALRERIDTLESRLDALEADVANQSGDASEAP